MKEKIYSAIFWALLGMVVGLPTGLLIAKSKVEPVQVSLGSGNISLKSSVQKADICVLTTNTTTPCSLSNTDPDQTKRYIQSVVLYLNDTSAGATTTLSMGTSTSQFGSTSESVWGSFALSTSTDPQYFSTSTYTTVVNREWAYGTYVNLKATTAAATTGYVKIIYDKAQ